VSARNLHTAMLLQCVQQLSHDINNTISCRNTAVQHP
jgi:hypothetical protein